MFAKKWLSVLLVVVISAALLLAACNPASSANPTAQPQTQTFLGDPESGLLLFNETCLECHTATLPTVFVGPSLQEAGARMTAEEIRTAIREPHRDAAPEFSGTAMPDIFGSLLSDQELADIVAYLVSEH